MRNYYFISKYIYDKCKNIYLELKEQEKLVYKAIDNYVRIEENFENFIMLNSKKSELLNIKRTRTLDTYFDPVYFIKSILDEKKIILMEIYRGSNSNKIFYEIEEIKKKFNEGMIIISSLYINCCDVFTSFQEFEKYLSSENITLKI